MSLEFGQNLRLRFLTAQSVAERRLNDHFLENRTILECDGERVGDGTLGWVMVVLGELRVLDTADALAEGLDEGRGSRLAVIGVVGGFEAVEDEHGCDHVLDCSLAMPTATVKMVAYLNAVVTVCKVLHGLELFVDDPDASFVRPVDNTLNIFGALAHSLEFLVQTLGGFDSSLRVELG
jgi:hypothetical protein